MPYQAMAFRVVIATPGDVPEERQLIRDAISDWNSAHSAKESVVLLPVAWETDTMPETGDRAQSIINKQIIEPADLLIAAFWTRLGTPTGKSPSGTVEEIQEMLAAGKSVMIYFSKRPVARDSVDADQYKALVEFREWCRDNSLFREYENAAEFQRKLGRELAMQVNNNPVFGQRSSSYGFVASARVSDPIESLSSESRTLLGKAAAPEANGMILRTRTLGGLALQVGKEDLAEGGDSRLEAVWQSALEELVAHDLARSLGPKNEVFQLTRKGYEAADRLRNATRQ